MEIFDRKIYNKNRRITREGEIISRIVLVTKGSVRVEMSGSNRRFVFGPGALLGFRSVIEGARNPVFLSTAIAIDDVECILMRVEDIYQDYRDSSPLVKSIFQSIFSSTDAIIKTYQDDSERRRKTLGFLNEEIAAVLEAERG